MNEVYRQEKKYFMTLFDMKKLSGQLDQVMIQDAHNGANGYNIRSLYFDTINERDYEAKIEGLELRRKIRLRIYDPVADFAMLEMKQKEGSYQKKRSLRVSREDAIEPVSYTHLDVYKRQCLSLAIWKKYVNFAQNIMLY